MLITPVDKIQEVLPPGRGSSLKAWQFPQCPFLIECSSAVLDHIRRDSEHDRSSQRGELEIGGVLFGVDEYDRVRILACRPLDSEHAMGPGFVLSEKDEQQLAELIASPATDAGLHGLEALGWYHSHIRSRIFLSERDRQIHSHFFGGPRQLALVVHPSSEAQLRAGFFFRELSGEMRTESSYEEFTIEPLPLTVPEPKPVEASEPGPTRRRTERPAKPPQKREAICPRCGSRHLQRSRMTGTLDQLRELLGYYPYRCHECLSRSFLKTSPDLLKRGRSGPRKRPEERRRAWLRTRREMLLWGGGIFVFLLILFFLISDTGAKHEAE